MPGTAALRYMCALNMFCSESGAGNRTCQHASTCIFWVQCRRFTKPSWYTIACQSSFLKSHKMQENKTWIKPDFFFFFLIYFHRIYTSVLASFQSPMMCGSNSRLVTNFPHRSTSGNLTRLLIQIARENERGLAQKGFAALRIFCLLLFTTMVFVLFICSLLF